MIIAQHQMPMNRYEMWVLIAGIAANLVLAWMSKAKAAVAAEKAVVAVEKAEGLEAKLDGVVLTIDGGLQEVLNTIRAEGHAQGVRDEKRRALTVPPDVTNAGPTDRHPGAPA